MRWNCFSFFSFFRFFLTSSFRLVSDISLKILISISCLFLFEWTNVVEIVFGLFFFLNYVSESFGNFKMIDSWKSEFDVRLFLERNSRKFQNNREVCRYLLSNWKRKMDARNQIRIYNIIRNFSLAI